MLLGEASFQQWFAGLLVTSFFLLDSFLRLSIFLFLTAASLLRVAQLWHWHSCHLGDRLEEAYMRSDPVTVWADWEFPWCSWSVFFFYWRLFLQRTLVGTFVNWWLKDAKGNLFGVLVLVTFTRKVCSIFKSPLNRINSCFVFCYLWPF